MSDSALNNIATLAEFLTYVRDPVMKQAKDYTGTLGDYFRSLLGVIENYNQESATYTLLAQVLAEALTHPPLPFDPAWFAYRRPPDDEEEAETDQFARLQDMLKYLIADWQLMDEAGILKNEERYFGVDSPTGNRWYNFDLVTFLECGTAGMGFNRAEDMSEDEYIILPGGVEFKGMQLLEQKSARSKHSA